jgi:hypothetical protein
VLLGRSFFPGLIASPFAKGLHLAFLAAAAMCFVGAIFSWMRGGGVQRHVLTAANETEEGLADVAGIAMAQVGVGSSGVGEDFESERTPVGSD